MIYSKSEPEDRAGAGASSHVYTILERCFKCFILPFDSQEDSRTLDTPLVETQAVTSYNLWDNTHKYTEAADSDNENVPLSARSKLTSQHNSYNGLQ